MTKILEWFRGKVLIRMNSCDISRLLNICSARKVELLKVIRNNSEICIIVSLQDFREFCCIAKKCKIRFNIEKKMGYPFIIYKYRRRPMAFIGIASAFLMMYILSIFIWKIDISGNVIHSDEEIIDYLSEIQVSCGMIKHDIKDDEIELKIRNNFFDITWVSVEVSGTKLVVSVKENSLQDIDNEYNDNIIADEDGVISSIVTRSGTPLVKKGDVVNAGDMLIKGEYDIINDAGELVNTVKVTAEGDIEMYCVYKYEDELLLNYESVSNVEKSTEYKISIGEYLLDLTSKNENGNKESALKQFCIGENFYLPIYIEKSKFYEYKIVEKVYTEDETISIINERLNYFLEKLDEKSIHIIENNVKIEFNGHSAIATGDIVVVKKIN